MTSALRFGFCSLIVLSAVACGGKSDAPPPAAPTAKGASNGPQDDVLRPVTNGQLKVAHYASGDGMTGLVLDRTGERPKVQFDKAKDIIELTMVEDRFAGERRGWYMKSPDGKNQLYLSSGGGLKTWSGNDEIYLNSDKAANPLPAATIVGEYKAPKSQYDIQHGKMLALALQTKTPTLASEDSGNLAKVREILTSTPKDQFVRLTDAGAQSAKWAPASTKIGNTIQGLGGPLDGYPTDDKFDGKGAGLAKFGGKLIPMQFEYGSPNQLRMHELAGWSSHPAKGTPGVVWEAKDLLVFVSVDGGRYELSSSSDSGDLFEAGAGSPSSWPAPLQHALLDVDTMRAFGKAKVGDASLASEAETTSDGWFECVNEVWKKTKVQLDATEASGASANDKWGKMSGIRKSAELEAPKKCEPARQKLEKVLLKDIDQRAAERKAIYDAVKARF